MTRTGEPGFGKLEGVLHQFVHDFAEIFLGHRHGNVRQFNAQILRTVRLRRLRGGVLLDQRGGMFRLPDAQGVDIFRVGGDQLELRVNQKVFDEPFQPLAGLVDFLAHFGNFGRLERGGGGGEHFGVGKNAVERRAHFVRHASG